MTKAAFISTIQSNKEWFTLQFLPDSFLEHQIELYQQGDDLDIEHYKWAAYHFILANEDLSDINRLKEFIQVIENDPNEHLYKGAVTILINDGILTKELLPLLKSTRIESNVKLMQRLNSILKT